MNLKDALKAVAPAVGDGKLVWQHAYVIGGESLRAYDGRMWASASLDASTPLFVAHGALSAAMARDGAVMLPDEGAGVIVRVGRSRLKLRGQDPAQFPLEPRDRALWTIVPPVDFKSTIEKLAPFCGKADNHIWQMGIHFDGTMAFAANPYALTVAQSTAVPSPVSVPPWAAEFILAQDEEPNVFANQGTVLSLLWSHRLALTAKTLIEPPAENIVNYARELLQNIDSATAPVPENLRDAVKRVKELGGTRVKIGAGKIEHMTDRLEFEEEIDLDVPAREWGIAPLLAALEHAETIDLRTAPGRWAGNGLKGVFSGMS